MTVANMNDDTNATCSGYALQHKLLQHVVLTSRANNTRLCVAIKLKHMILKEPLSLNPNPLCHLSTFDMHTG